MTDLDEALGFLRSLEFESIAAEDYDTENGTSYTPGCGICKHWQGAHWPDCKLLALLKRHPEIDTATERKHIGGW